MRFELPALLMLAATAAMAQSGQATIRVDVVSNSAPVQDAEVTMNGKQVRTSLDGVAVLSAEFGHVDIVVSKDHFIPARKALNIDAGREWQIEIELQPNKEHEE